MIINCDVDGVVYPWGDTMAMLADLAWPGGHFPEFQNWTGWEQWTKADGSYVTRDEFRGLWYRGVEEGIVFAIGKPIPGSFEGINALIEDGHTVRLVTNKLLDGPEVTYKAQMNMSQWLIDEGFPAMPVVYDWAKSRYPADAVIDDRPFGEWPQAGKLNILFAQPWNEEWVFVVGDGPLEIERIQGWRAVVERIREHAR